VEEGDVRRYLVVANQTLGGDHLLERLRAATAEDRCVIHVVVPSSSDPGQATHDLDSDRTLASRRLAAALERFRDLDADVTGEVGDHRPVDAVRDVLRRDWFDEIIVSTLPIGVSRWVRMDVVRQIERAVGRPVVHIVAADTLARG
jgi:hypothetical protein